MYDGTILSDTWHRVAFVVDLTLGTDSLRKYIDGALVGTQTLAASPLDGRWSLDPTAHFFTDNDGETALGYVNSIQIHDAVLSDAYILSLGGATAEGLPAIPEPASGLLLGAGLLLLALQRGRSSK